jgi:hypothetical protein
LSKIDNYKNYSNLLLSKKSLDNIIWFFEKILFKVIVDKYDNKVKIPKL